MKQATVLQNSERGSAMIAMVILAMAMVGFVTILANNPTFTTKLLSDKSIKDSQAIQSVKAKGLSVMAVGSDGTLSYSNALGLIEFQAAKDILTNNGYTNAIDTCGVIYFVSFAVPGTPASVNAAFIDKEGGIDCGPYAPPAECNALAANLLQSEDPTATQESYVACYKDNVRGDIFVVPIFTSATGAGTI